MGIVSGEKIVEHCMTNVIPPIENKKQKIWKHSYLCNKDMVAINCSVHQT